MKKKSRRLRRKNPGDGGRAAAAKAYAQFHGETPHKTLRIEVPSIPGVTYALGRLYAVEYDGVRDGRHFRFRHVFSKRARPFLVVPADGKALYIAGGSFRVTDRGIVDQK